MNRLFFLASALAGGEADRMVFKVPTLRNITRSLFP